MFCRRNQSKSIVCFLIFFTAGFFREIFNWNTRRNKQWNLALLIVFLTSIKGTVFEFLLGKKIGTELNRLNSFVKKIFSKFDSKIKNIVLPKFFNKKTWGNQNKIQLLLWARHVKSIPAKNSIRFWYKNMFSVNFDGFF